MDRIGDEKITAASRNTYLKKLLKNIPDAVLENSALGHYAKMHSFQLKYDDVIHSRYEMSESDLSSILQALIKYKVDLDDDMLEILRKLLFEIDDNLIMNLKCSRVGIEYLLYQKYGGYRLQAVEQAKQAKICIDFITIKSTSMIIEGNINWNIFLYKNQPEIFIAVEEYRYAAQIANRVENKKFLGTVISKVLEFQAEVPIKAMGAPTKIDFYVGLNGILQQVDSLRFGKFAPLSEKLDYAYYACNNWVLKRQGSALYMYNRKATLRDELQLLHELMRGSLWGGKKAIVARIIYHFLKIFKKRPIWIFMDKADRADDNAECLLDYIMTLPDDNVRRYFMIGKQTEDYKRLKRKYHVVPYLSYRHKLLLLLSDYTISGYIHEEIYNPFYNYNDPYRDLLQNVNYIFLDHGVKKDALAHSLSKYKKNMKMMVCTGIPEYQSIVDDGDYGYQKEQIKLTGLCRYDRLYDDSKNHKIVAIMPTWRSYLTNGMIREESKFLLKRGFKNSYYYKFYINLLTSERLLEALRKHGFELHFIPHPTMFPYADLFRCSDFVKVWGTEVVHRDIYAKSSLLVTDYSSLAFDFANLKKPIIYCQFDLDEFYGKGGHRSSSYFDFERDGFGEVVYSLDETIDMIINYVENGCVMKPIYRQRVDSFFKYQDQNNCKRVLEAINDIK